MDGFTVVSPVANSGLSLLTIPGMALRLAFDLALHIDLSPYVARGSVTAADAELRRTVFWAAYMVDQ